MIGGYTSPEGTRKLPRLPAGRLLESRWARLFRQSRIRLLRKTLGKHRRAIAKAQVYYVSLYQLTSENQRQMGLWDHAGGHEALPVGQACVCRPDQIHRVDAR